MHTLSQEQCTQGTQPTRSALRSSCPYGATAANTEREQKVLEAARRAKELEQQQIEDRGRQRREEEAEAERKRTPQLVLRHEIARSNAAALAPEVTKLPPTPSRRAVRRLAQRTAPHRNPL